MMNNLCDLAYAAGNPVTMLKFIEASCSIPGVVPHKNLGGHSYVDGGVVCASPVAYFVKALILKAKESKKRMHFTCHTCEDINSHNGGCYKRESVEDGNTHLIESIMDTFTSMLTVSLVRDRVACGDVITSLGSTLLGYVAFKAIPANVEALKAFKEEEEGSCQGTVSELYCDEIGSYMDMANFNGEMCLKTKEYADEHIMCRLWVYCNGDPKELLESKSLQSLRHASVEDQLPD